MHSIDHYLILLETTVRTIGYINKLVQLLEYAHALDIIAITKTQSCKTFMVQESAAREIGLRVNESKIHVYKLKTEGHCKLPFNNRGV